MEKVSTPDHTLNYEHLVNDVRHQATKAMGTLESPGYTHNAVSNALQLVASEIDPDSPRQLQDWRVNASDSGDYLYVSKEGRPGEIHVKSEFDGYVVDAVKTDGTVSEVVGSIAVPYEDLTPSELLEVAMEIDADSAPTAGDEEEQP